MRRIQQWCQACMQWWILGLLICLTVWWLTGCTTIMHPDRLQTVVINSSPAGARITINGTAEGVTPAQVALDRSRAYTVELQKPSYQVYRQALAKQTDPMFFVNVIFLPGFVVDLATNTWQAFPAQVDGMLQPLTAQR
jgi:PEGA domain